MAPSGTERGSRWTVIYDADCGFCRWSLGLLLGADRRRRLRPLALQSPEADALLADLTPDQRMASWHLVSPAGERRSAGAALPAVLELLPGGRAPASILAALPRATERGYGWVAAHRTTLGPLIPRWAKQSATRSIEHRASERG